ncbi:Rqc2 family fibronectin-binding protein [Gemelliphila palaticanis]|uniref:Rqc2 homolog RqcH n=1 Tax=Gemelliphila palaticanis TaxID=81950 RepID=A0ABX2SZR2_9BACL|nr:NFACT family protein [Gemella palaticanis]MBF0714913.1 NFACT family protein [Gemella palaticanis]NYS46843.1 NFACT family protein [Gemella palaticanis]
MAFDGFFTNKIVKELNYELERGRINKINNISTNDIIITIRKNTNKKLIISANTNNFRIHITNKNHENPDRPSNFCTLLRKYLLNGFIVNFEQVNNDRIVIIKIRNTDELGYEKNYNLIVELMGKHSNIILTDSNNIILDAIKNDYNIEFKRYTIANTPYKLPPTKEKINPFDKSKYNNIKKLEDNKFFINNFYGFSKILNDFFINKGINDFQEFISNFENINHPIYFENKKDFYYFNIFNESNNIISFNSYSELLDFVYINNHRNDINKQNNKKLFSFVNSKITSLNKKIKILESELNKLENSEEYQLKGQLILSNNYLFKNNIPSEIVLQNFYSEELENITIKLDSSISIEKNAEKYFNKSKKNKRAIENLKEQIIFTNNDIKYFDNILNQLENADISDLEEIKEELVRYKYLKLKENKKFKKSKIKSVKFKDIEIFIGKSNIQNDTITNKLANKNYLWFHAKDIPGSHVVIFSSNYTEDHIKIASQLAAYFSKNKEEKYVLVDYTQIKFVKKIPNAKVGMVTYSNQKTVKVEIDRQLINSII